MMPLISLSGSICVKRMVFIGNILLVSGCPDHCDSCILDGETPRCAVDGCKPQYAVDSTGASCSGKCLHLQCLE